MTEKGVINISESDLKLIDEKVRSLFKVEINFTRGQLFSSLNLPSYIVNKSSNLKESFIKLHYFLKNYGLIPVLREEAVEASPGRSSKVSVLRLGAFKPRGGRRLAFNLALLFLTIATVSATGLYFSVSPPFLEVYPETNILFVSLGFTGGLMGIIGLHELGHIFTLRKVKSDSSPPYFIPGIPVIGLPTFGAVIIQRTPPVNRDALFDMGISGPIMSFTVSLIVLLIGTLLSKAISPSFAEYLLNKYPGLGPLPVPLLFIIIQNILLPEAGGVIFIHPIAYAGWLGLIITALNLFPIGQLDGGHAARALFGENNAKYMSYVMIAVLVALGYWLMAILIFLIGGFKHEGPLDDVSPLKNSRKIAWLVSMGLLVLSVTPFLVFF